MFSLIDKVFGLFLCSVHCVGSSYSALASKIIFVTSYCSLINSSRFFLEDCFLAELIALTQRSRVVCGFRLVRQLSACYEASFGTRCGRDAGQLVAGLVDQAFDDPRYTRYRHRPDCRLHRQDDEDDRPAATFNVSATAAAAAAAAASPSSSLSASVRQRQRRRHRTGGTEKRRAPPETDLYPAASLETLSSPISSLVDDRRLPLAELAHDLTLTKNGELNYEVENAASCGHKTVFVLSLTTRFVSVATLVYAVMAFCILRQLG
jgi:hypothetical protein